MYWAALLLDHPSDVASQHDRLQGVAVWALQWTPRVAIVDEAVCLEVDASLRLFGGTRALRERIRPAGGELGVAAASWAPTSLAAVALARTCVLGAVRDHIPHHVDSRRLERNAAGGVAADRARTG